MQAEALVCSTNKSQAPEDGCTNTRNMLNIKYPNFGIVLG